jgi:uncharacterized cupredoxin-like copper-binding protein
MTGPPPRFVPDSLTVAAGQDAVFFLTNHSHGVHTFALGPSRDAPPLAGSTGVLLGDSALFTVHGLKPGAYVFWCTVDDHANEGMVGALTVAAP